MIFPVLHHKTLSPSHYLKGASLCPLCLSFSPFGVFMFSYHACNNILRYPPAVLRFFLRVNFVLYLFDGSDWDIPMGFTPTTLGSSSSSGSASAESTSSNLFGSRKEANMEVVVNALEIQFTQFGPGTQVRSSFMRKLFLKVFNNTTTITSMCADW